MSAVRATHPNCGNTRPSGWLNADLVARGGFAGVE